MKILHTVEFYHPSVGGMQEVVKQLSERLVQYGHEVTVATTKLTERNQSQLNGVKIIEFDICGNYVRGISGEIQRYQLFLCQPQFDIVVNFAAQQWATDLALPILDKIPAKKVFVPTGFSNFYIPEYQEYFLQLKKWMKNYDASVFLSDDYRDINFARENNINHIVLIPNGADEREFATSTTNNIRQRLGIPQHHFLVLHVGSHTGMKGHREAISIFKQARIHEATFLLIGGDSGACFEYCRKQQALFRYSWQRILRKKFLQVRSLARVDTVAAYQEADVFLFPSNIECSPIVLFECMASKTPFLTTNVGNAQEIIDWSKGGTLLPTLSYYPKKQQWWLKKLAKKILRALKLRKQETPQSGYSCADIKPSAKILRDFYLNHSQQKEMQESGFSAWNKKFSWKVIAKEYEKLYLKLLTGNSNLD